MDSCLRRNDGEGEGVTGAARPPLHTPRACFARTRPFRRGRKGLGTASPPGIPLRSRSARPRPPYAGAKGDWDGLRCWIPACGGMTGVGGGTRARPPRHPHPSPLPSRERGWIPACAGMTGGGLVVWGIFGGFSDSGGNYY